MPDTSALLKRLQGVARRREIVHYGEIADSLGLDMSLDCDRAQIGRILGDLSEFEHREGRPLISAVVVASDTGMPGKGFFSLARSLGSRIQDADELYLTELNKVWDYWSSHQAKESEGMSDV